MNSIDKIEGLFKQLSENSDKLSVILPQLYPIALECKDLVGFCLLYFWGTPLDTNNEVNQLYYQNAKKMMCSAGITKEVAQEIAQMAMEKYLTMRTVTRDNTQMDPIKIWPAQKLEKFFKQCDERIAELKVPEGLSSIDSYQREQKINLQKLSILSDKTKAENQYAILHQLITSKLAEYQTKLSQMEEIGTTQENNMTPYEKLRKLRDEIDELIDKQMTYSLPEFKNWHKELGLFLSEKYGTQSKQYKNFIGRSFAPSLPHTSAQDYIDSCKRGLEITRTELSAYLDDMKGETTELAINIPKEKGEISMGKETKDRKKVFIVHGHNGELKQMVARLVEKQGIEAIILHEQPNKGATIIEKFEQNSDVGAAICLFTADDIGKAKTEEQEKDRARQNVVFEAGFFMGKLGRDHVITIADRGVELPSDMQGIVYTDSTSLEFEVLKELDGMGYTIDMNKLKGR